MLKLQNYYYLCYGKTLELSIKSRATEETNLVGRAQDFQVWAPVKSLATHVRE